MVSHILSIVESLCTAAQGELTINQLAKVLKKSYGYTNTHVHALAAQGILAKREVGSAILCSLNYSTEETLGLLSLISIRKKRAYIDSLNQKENAVLMKTLELIAPVAHTAYIDNLRKQTLTIVTDLKTADIDGHTGERIGDRMRLIRTADFMKTARSLDLKSTVVLQHHEAFWNVIAQQRNPRY
jgi:hypothetical protein